MDPNNLDQHLSQMETHWTAVFQAHQDRSVEAAEAQAELVLRYGGAVHRYLLASLRDVDAADELAQEFALRFLRGDFKNADPGKGRFRDFLKRSVARLMIDYHRARRARPRPLEVLRLRVASPELNSLQLAERLSQRLGRPVKSGWIRLNLHRARDMFVKSLIDEVKRSLGAHPDRLEDELSELGLLEYCRSVLDRCAPPPAT
jgi:RNA polymerase sigma-70 factor (ECF subfamily)